LGLSIPTKPVIIQKGDSLIYSLTGLTYQWLDSSGSKLLSNTQNYKPTQKGFYQLKVTNKNGCSNTSNLYYFNFTNINSIQSINRDDVQLYPNPSYSDEISLKTDKSYKKISILSNEGKWIETLPNPIKSGINIISIKGLPQGIYYIRLENKDIAPVYIKFVRDR
jgi:hypothetical protein